MTSPFAQCDESTRGKVCWAHAADIEQALLAEPGALLDIAGLMEHARSLYDEMMPAHTGAAVMRVELDACRYNDGSEFIVECLIHQETFIAMDDLPTDDHGRPDLAALRDTDEDDDSPEPILFTFAVPSAIVDAAVATLDQDTVTEWILDAEAAEH